MKIHPVVIAALLLFGLLSSVPAWSQETTSESSGTQIDLGLKLGDNIGLFRNNNVFTLWDNSSNVFGYQAGVYASYKALDFLNLRLEALYNNQGARLAKVVYSNSLKNINGKLHFNSIQIPLLAELGIPSFDGSISPKLLLGGFYSYTYNVQSTFDQITTLNDGSTYTAHGQQDVSNLFRHNQFGFIVGVGATLLIADKPLLIELRYTHTLNNVAIDGFQYSYLASTQKKYGSNFYPTSVGVNVSYPIFSLFK